MSQFTWQDGVNKVAPKLSKSVQRERQRDKLVASKWDAAAEAAFMKRVDPQGNVAVWHEKVSAEQVG